MSSNDGSAEAGGLLGGVRRLYHWVLSWAASPWGPAALFVLSFVESSFFPIPPDPLLLALCLGAVSRSFTFAAICTVASVLGGLFGYFIGHFMFEAVGKPVLAALGQLENVHTAREMFTANGEMAVLVAAFTPIPYKLITITAGASGMHLLPFTLWSIVGRGGRFFLVAGLIWWQGERVAGFIEAHFEKLTLALSVLLIGGFFALRLLF